MDGGVQLVSEGCASCRISLALLVVAATVSQRVCAAVNRLLARVVAESSTARSAATRTRPSLDAAYRSATVLVGPIISVISLR
eukprot:1779098-Pleurochrysis_carterae.AAC.5